MASTSAGPRLPPEILHDIVDILVAQTDLEIDAIKVFFHGLNARKKDHWPQARKDSFAALLSMSAINKRMRHVFWKKVWPSLVPFEDVLPVLVYPGEEVWERRKLPTAIMHKIRHVWLHGRVTKGPPRGNLTLNSFLGPIVRENKIDVLSLDLNTFQSLYMWESKKAENDTSDDQTDDDEEDDDAAEERGYKTLVQRAMPHVHHLHVHQDDEWGATPLRALDCIGGFRAVTLTSLWDPNELAYILDWRDDDDPPLPELGLDPGQSAELANRLVAPCGQAVIAKSRRIRLFQAIARFVFSDSTSSTASYSNGPSSSPAQLLEQSERFIAPSAIEVWSVCLKIETTSGKTIWEGACQARREMTGKFRLIHDNAWQNPQTLLPGETWRRNQIIAEISHEPSYDHYHPQDLDLDPITLEYFTY